MTFIAKKEKNFKKYLERHFAIFLPQDVDIFYAKGVRVGNRNIYQSQIHGELGYAACDFGFNPTNAFIQNFGHLARRNVVTLDEKQALEFAEGKSLQMDLGSKSKYLVMKYGNHVLGLGHYEKDSRRVINKIPKKRRRRIINSIS